MAKAKKKTNKKTTRKNTKKQAAAYDSALFKTCLSLCLIVISVISFFKLGIVGIFCFQFFSYFLGSASYLVFVLCILLCLFFLFKKDRKLSLIHI